VEAAAEGINLQLLLLAEEILADRLVTVATAAELVAAAAVDRELQAEPHLVILVLIHTLQTRVLHSGFMVEVQGS
jgi:hypothetical protein